MVFDQVRKYVFLLIYAFFTFVCSSCVLHRNNNFDSENYNVPFEFASYLFVVEKNCREVLSITPNTIYDSTYGKELGFYKTIDRNNFYLSSDGFYHYGDHIFIFDKKAINLFLKDLTYNRCIRFVNSAYYDKKLYFLMEKILNGILLQKNK